MMVLECRFLYCKVTYILYHCRHAS